MWKLGQRSAYTNDINKGKETKALNQDDLKDVYMPSQKCVTSIIDTGLQKWIISSKTFQIKNLSKSAP